MCVCIYSTLSYLPTKNQQLPFSPCPFPAVLSLSPSYSDIIELAQIFYRYTQKAEAVITTNISDNLASLQGKDITIRLDSNSTETLRAISCWWATPFWGLPFPHSPSAWKRQLIFLCWVEALVLGWSRGTHWLPPTTLPYSSVTSQIITYLDVAEEMCVCVCVFLRVCWPPATTCEKKHHEVDLSLWIRDTGWQLSKTRKAQDTKLNDQSHGKRLALWHWGGKKKKWLWMLFLRSSTQQPTNFISVLVNYGGSNRKLSHFCS